MGIFITKPKDIQTIKDSSLVMRDKMRSYVSINTAQKKGLSAKATQSEYLKKG